MISFRSKHDADWNRGQVELMPSMEDGKTPGWCWQGLEAPSRPHLFALVCSSNMHTQMTDLDLHVFALAVSMLPCQRTTYFRVGILPEAKMVVANPWREAPLANPSRPSHTSRGLRSPTAIHHLHSHHQPPLSPSLVVRFLDLVAENN